MMICMRAKKMAGTDLVPPAVCVPDAAFHSTLASKDDFWILVAMSGAIPVCFKLTSVLFVQVIRFILYK